MHGRIFAYTTVDLIANREALNDICLPAPDTVHDDMPDAVDYPTLTLPRPESGYRGAKLA